MRKIAVVLTLALVAATAAAQEHHPKPQPNPALDQLKTLAGDWEGKYQGPEGEVAGKMRITVVSNGSAVMMSMDEGAAGEMITMFHGDGPGKVVATHYCSAQNQPRMKLASFDGKRMVFDFLDVTSAPADGAHMRGLVLTLDSPDQHTEEWLWGTAGKAETGKFTFHRVKK